MKLENGAVEQIDTLLKSAGAQVERAMHIAMEQDDATVMYCSQEIARNIEILQKAILRRDDHMSITEEFELYGDDDCECDCDDCPYSDECGSEEEYDECKEFEDNEDSEVAHTFAMVRAVLKDKEQKKDGAVKKSDEGDLLKALYDVIGDFIKVQEKYDKKSSNDKGDNKE